MEGTFEDSVGMHCNEELAYRSHKALYYVESEERWLTHCDKGSGSSTVTTMPHLVETADAGIIEDTQMDQTGNLNIASYLFPVASSQALSLQAISQLF